jgi:glycosidase
MLIVGAYPRMFFNHESVTDIKAVEQFFDETLDPSVGIHLLPPWTADGDGGFAVTSWRKVDERYGTVDDLKSLAVRRPLMLDGIFNHVAWEHPLAQRFLGNPRQHHNLVHAVSGKTPPQAPLAPRGGSVYRPRAIDGNTWHVWQTFGADSVDLNLHDPEVQAEVSRILEFLAGLGTNAIRLDALPYYGKNGLESALHNPDGIVAAEAIVARSRELGMRPVLQIDCDGALEIYRHLSRYRPDVIDFSYDTYLLYSFLTGDTREFAAHLEATRQHHDVGIHRPIRTHDGILLRSGNQRPEFVSRVLDICEGRLFQVRMTNNNPYELNNSMPYLLGADIDPDLNLQKIAMGVIIGVLTSEATYIYLGALIGDVPELTGDFDADPRELQRRPIDMKGSAVARWRSSTTARDHIQALARISSDASHRGVERKGYEVSTNGPLLDIRNDRMNLAAILNFSQVPQTYRPSDQTILSASAGSGTIHPFGYEVSRIREAA